MRPRHLFAGVTYLALAACAGGPFVTRAPGYDAQSVAGRPVGMELVGVPQAEESAVIAAITDSLLAHGVPVGTIRSTGATESGYRLAVVAGPRAAEAARDADSNNACRRVGEASAAASAPAPAVAGGVPVAALMCAGVRDRAMAYAVLRPGEPIVVALPGMIDQLFPASPVSD
jgi:hypothetical protein